MDIAASLLEALLPMIFFLFPLLIPVLIVMRVFRFKDVIVKLMDEAQRNPDLYKNNPAAMRDLLKKLQQSPKGAGGLRNSSGAQSTSKLRSSTSGARASVPVSRSGGVRHSSRNLSSRTPTKRLSPLRGTSRMTQVRQEHKLKTTVAVLLLLGGVTLLFSTYFYGFENESFLASIVLMAAGLYLLKSGVERV